jgi:molybdate transport system regulatory protein
MSAPTVRIRIVFGRGIAIGPGKADLLAAIDEHGSIAAAGRMMGMSYQRAWSLVDDLNGAFREPLVSSSRGGASRGGATLTDFGRTMLERYRSIESRAASLCESELAEIDGMLKREESDISNQR